MGLNDWDTLFFFPNLESGSFMLAGAQSMGFMKKAHTSTHMGYLDLLGNLLSIEDTSFICLWSTNERHIRFEKILSFKNGNVPLIIKWQRIVITYCSFVYEHCCSIQLLGSYKFEIQEPWNGGSVCGWVTCESILKSCFLFSQQQW